MDWPKRKCLLKYITVGKIGQIRRRGRRHKQLLDYVKEKKIHCNVKEEALGRTRCGRGYEPAARHNTQ